MPLARVVVHNNTGRPIYGLKVIHKYSDDAPQEGSWEILGAGATSTELEVKYNTGFFTTGKDWWKIAWMSESGEICFSDPRSFREIVDALEGIFRSIGPAVVGAATTILTGSPSAGKAAAGAVEIVNKFVLNSAETVGFKQHILRNEDAKPALNTIVINADHTIKLVSPSDNSETVWAHTGASAELAELVSRAASTAPRAGAGC